MPEWTEERSSVSPETRDRLILEHIPLLRHIVGRMSFETSALEREDLYGVGMLGLIAAADSWEPERGLKFSTHAFTRIRGAILDELRRSDFLPRGRRESVRELEQVVEHLRQAHGVAPAPEEIAQAMGIDCDEVDGILAAAALAHQASLDDGPGESLSALLIDPRSSDPTSSAEWQEMKALLAQAISELTDQEQTVITLYYAESLLLKEIAGVLDVTESRVSQIHTRALYRLNRSLALQLGGSAD